MIFKSLSIDNMTEASAKAHRDVLTSSIRGEKGFAFYFIMLSLNTACIVLDVRILEIIDGESRP
jgi:hypothetical protein